MTTALSRILYVDDDPDISAVAKLPLVAVGGFDVLHCDSGKAALDSFVAFSPHLRLVDVMMPLMDGLQTLANLRLMPHANDRPIIFMTARAQRHEQERYLKLGALGVVVKPFNPMTPSDSIRELWETRYRGQPDV